MVLTKVNISLFDTFEIKYNKKTEREIPKFAKAIAKRITGPHNQDFRIIVTGAFGKGKSTFCLYLGYRIALEVAKIKGGKWQDYFSKNTIAIADEDEIKRIFTSLENFNIYLLDDVGKAWGARDFMSKLNKLFNDIFQLMRTARTCLIISIASTFLVDKVPRNLVNVLVEMDQSLYDYGAATVKIKKVKHRPQFGDIHYPFFQFRRNKVIRHVSLLPPDELLEDYIKERERIEILLRNKAKVNDEGRKEDGQNPPPIIQQVHQFMSENPELNLDDIKFNFPYEDPDYITRCWRNKMRKDRRRTPPLTAPLYT